MRFLAIRRQFVRRIGPKAVIRCQSSRTTESLDGEEQVASSRAHSAARSAARAGASWSGTLAIAGAGGWGFAGSADVAGAAGTSSQQAETCGAHSGPDAGAACSGQHGAQCALANARAPGGAQSTSASASRAAIRVLIAMER